MKRLFTVSRGVAWLLFSLLILFTLVSRSANAQTITITGEVVEQNDYDDVYGSGGTGDATGESTNGSTGGGGNPLTFFLEGQANGSVSGAQSATMAFSANAYIKVKYTVTFSAPPSGMDTTQRRTWSYAYGGLFGSYSAGVSFDGASETTSSGNTGWVGIGYFVSNGQVVLTRSLGASAGGYAIGTGASAFGNATAKLEIRFPENP